MGAEQVADKGSIFTSPSIVIIVLCIISYFIETVPGIGSIYGNAFQFDPNSLFTRPWTLITYIFLHIGLWHLFFNMLVLYFFGTALESRVGNKQLLAIFFTAGILSAIGYTFLSGPIFNIAPGPMVGASGAIYGVFAALTMLEPDLTRLCLLYSNEAKICPLCFLLSLTFLWLIPRT